MMRTVIEKELCNPLSVNGYCEVPGPLYHIYKVDEDGKKTFVKTVEKDIKEAAREAERLIDIDVLEVAYKKNPDSFKSTVTPENSIALLDEIKEQLHVNLDWDKSWDRFGGELKKS